MAYLMKKISYYFLLLTFFSSWSLLEASFTVQSVSSGDSVTILTSPSEAATEFGPRDDNIMYAFEEDQNVTLTGDVDVNHVVSAPGASSIVFDDDSDLTDGSIASGTTGVSSYYFYFRPDDETNASKQIEATFLFSNEIIGFMTSGGRGSETLDSTPAELALDGTTYGHTTLEFTAPGTCDICDTITISADRKTATVEFHTTTSYDTLRILTRNNATAVPEPETYLLMGGTLSVVLALSWMKKRRRKVS